MRRVFSCLRIIFLFSSGLEIEIVNLTYSVASPCISGYYFRIYIYIYIARVINTEVFPIRMRAEAKRKKCKRENAKRVSE